jgi:hypothetical protein
MCRRASTIVEQIRQLSVAQKLQIFPLVKEVVAPRQCCEVYDFGRNINVQSSQSTV